MTTAFISGHLDLTQEEFDTHYAPRIREAIALGHCFVVGDARGVDTMAQRYLLQAIQANKLNTLDVVVYHAYAYPRHNVGHFPHVGRFESQTAKDNAMTRASDYDILWIRKGKEDSGTARNFQRRLDLKG